ncbi:MAG: peptidyl-prolyl cis-trans isomerase [Pseudomonadales bacterium]|nr:peptidyl-prolyl cis-trans isomerase [Pseudomonadales bacterium]
MFKRLLTEPLVHFLFIAILFFVVYDVLNPNEFTAQTVTVSEGRTELIKNQFVDAWKREPRKNEMHNAIQSYALNEIYLREAKALGFDSGDKVINRRLRQKMTYMLEDMASGKEATEQELKTYYQHNPEKYRLEVKYSFTQVYISIDRPTKELEQLLTLQRQNIAKGLAPEGDGSLLAGEISLQTEPQLVRRFGKGFVSQLKNQPLQQWSGPIKSGLGRHFVFLKQRSQSDLKPFDQLSKKVKAKILEDWQYQNIKDYKKQYEEQLLTLYHVEVFTPSKGGYIK